MQLKQRKKINNNIERFDLGVNNPYDYTVDRIDNDGIQRPINQTTALGFDSNTPITKQDFQAASDIASRYGSGDMLPETSGYEVGGKPKIGWEAGGSIISNGIQFAQSVNDSFGDVAHTGELQANAGSRYAYGSGFGYQRQNDIDTQQQLRKLSKENTANTFKAMGTGAALGGAIGSIFPGAGTLIGTGIGAVVGGVVGLFGSKHRKNKLNKRMFNAQQQINRNNNYAQSSAQTDYLQQEYRQQYGNTQDDVIYSANRGKDLKQPIIKHE